MNVGVDTADMHFASAAILGWIWNAVTLGTLVAGVTWLLLRPLRGRIAPALEVALWSIVLLKFILPIGPQWSYSLASLYQRTPLGLAGATVVDERPELIPSAAGTAAPAQPTDAVALDAPLRLKWTVFAAAGYVLIVAGMGARRLRSYRALRRRCLALPQPDEHTQALVRAVCRRLGLRAVPEMRISPDPRAPFVMGFVRPLLVLSRRHLVRPDEMETVVVHEVTHLRRGDLLVRGLQCVAGTLLFFWPVVAWVNRRIDRAREYACDEWALRHGKLPAWEYARCLLDAVQPPGVRRAAYVPACMAGHPSTIERRIDVILAQPSCPSRQRVWNLLALGLVVAWGSCALAGPAGPKKVKVDDKTRFEAAEQSMRDHAQDIYGQILDFSATSDIDGSGDLSKQECWAFVATIMMQDPAATLAAYPKADANADGKLELVEAYRYGRGDYDLEALRQKLQAEIETAAKSGDEARAEQLKGDAFIAEMNEYHSFLDRRLKIVQLMKNEPTKADVQAVAKKMVEVDAKLAAEREKDWLSQVAAEIDELRAKASELRAKAAESNGETAQAMLDKAAKLDEKAAQYLAKVTSSLEEKIAQLEASGDQKQADQIRAKLNELQGE